ncbi:Chimeric ERCC6-PGBD3 protein [Frankliniella fusca]|uniref:Chimeric ERCC6-PGBD3 protein n=1 Tax=Frankliniella fusca TaxID=407009 RepID=A0AAE1LIK8_9NEOP|nr:Chimeric ERCC6-PGBD3 protein [Frankliniella fusca]
MNSSRACRMLQKLGIDPPRLSGVPDKRSSCPDNEAEVSVSSITESEARFLGLVQPNSPRSLNLPDKSDSNIKVTQVNSPEKNCFLDQRKSGVKKCIGFDSSDDEPFSNITRKAKESSEDDLPLIHLAKRNAAPESKESPMEATASKNKKVRSKLPTPNNSTFKTKEAGSKVVTRLHENSTSSAETSYSHRSFLTLARTDLKTNQQLRPQQNSTSENKQAASKALTELEEHYSPTVGKENGHQFRHTVATTISGNDPKLQTQFTSTPKCHKVSLLVPADSDMNNNDNNCTVLDLTVPSNLSILDLSGFEKLDCAINMSQNSHHEDSNELDLFKNSMFSSTPTGTTSHGKKSSALLPSSANSATLTSSRPKRKVAVPNYCLESEDEENEIFEIEEDTEWLVNDPGIHNKTNDRNAREGEESDSESDGSDEGEVRVTLPKNNLKGWREKLAPPMDNNQHEVTDWKREDIVVQDRQPVLVPAASHTLRKPFAYFQYFFDDDLLAAMVNHTNTYSIWKHEKSMNLSRSELKQFLGTWMYMGICVLPGLRDYWASSTSVPQVSKNMTFNRFQKIQVPLALI